MKKILFLLILIVISIMIFSEPYRPYPVIAVHGYNANNYKKTNFGIVMQGEEGTEDANMQPSIQHEGKCDNIAVYAQ